MDSHMDKYLLWHQRNKLAKWAVYKAILIGTRREEKQLLSNEDAAVFG